MVRVKKSEKKRVFILPKKYLFLVIMSMHVDFSLAVLGCVFYLNTVNYWQIIKKQTPLIEQ